MNHSDSCQDCETIVSTYSNLENRPSVIDAGAPRRQPRGGSRAASNISASPAIIKLGKTGLPVDYVPHKRAPQAGAEAGAGDDGERGSGDDDSGEEGAPDWRGNTRRKGETAEEKRARKAAVKEGRREARAAKKETKQLFKQEAKATQPRPATGAVRAGASVMPLL